MTKLKFYIDCYKTILGLDEYCIEAAIAEDKIYQSIPDEKLKRVSTEALAEVVKIGHRKFLIVFYKMAFNKDLKNTVIHELLHILWWDMLECYELNLSHTDLCDGDKVKLLENGWKHEHKVIEKLIPLVKRRQK